MKNIVLKDENLSLEILADTTANIFSFQVPGNSKFTLTHFGNYIKEFDAWGSITWILKKNGVPIHRYHEIKDQLGWGAMLRELTGVDIPGGSLFTIDIKNEYIDTCKCGVAIKYQIEESQ